VNHEREAEPEEVLDPPVGDGVEHVFIVATFLDPPHVSRDRKFLSFETKGLEYLLVISFLIGFIYFVRRLSYSNTTTAPAETSESAATVANPDMVCPAGADCPHERQRMTAEEEDQRAAVVT